MRANAIGSRVLPGLAMLLILNLALVFGVEAVQEGAAMPVALRISGGGSLAAFDSANLTLELGIGSGPATGVLVADLPYLPLWGAVLRGEVSWTKEWISLRGRLSYDTALGAMGYLFSGRGAPPAIALHSGNPGVLLGVEVSAASTGIAGASSRQTLTMTPYVTSVATPWAGALVIGSVLPRIEMGAAGASPRINATTLVVTLDMDCPSWTSTTVFDGLFGRVASQSLTVDLPRYGIRLMGTVTAREDRDWSVRLGASLTFGESAVLGSESDHTGGAVCTGDTCFVP